VEKLVKKSIRNKNIDDIENIFHKLDRVLLNGNLFWKYKKINDGGNNIPNLKIAPDEEYSASM
tara:strand:+ start:1487 stop:1675 length:189 start_codon:yes stop_codon:yes gene_type:complete